SRDLFSASFFANFNYTLTFLRKIGKTPGKPAERRLNLLNPDGSRDGLELMSESILFYNGLVQKM
ncbi:MAG: hypothetical protein NC079_08520, partial [Clostridium sp.]|nr:hypothetical protein [Acetatifactor muris]MCM1527360.1 hypothetical protein [Bacteroides sp.]MCM1563638.1 hypothetical protein [Clostridium sp.]